MVVLLIGAAGKLPAGWRGGWLWPRDADRVCQDGGRTRERKYRTRPYPLAVSSLASVKRECAPHPESLA
jgi:hypothetical protein